MRIGPTTLSMSKGGRRKKIIGNDATAKNGSMHMFEQACVAAEND